MTHIFSYIFPAWVSGLSMAWKIVIMAELLATSDGLGAELAIARSQLDTPTALALVTIMIGSLMFIEYIMMWLHLFILRIFNDSKIKYQYE